MPTKRRIAVGLECCGMNDCDMEDVKETRSGVLKEEWGFMNKLNRKQKLTTKLRQPIRRKVKARRRDSNGVQQGQIGVDNNCITNYFEYKDKPGASLGRRTMGD